MILQYSFRKSFLISSPPLKPDQQPIQQLLPPQIPPSSLVRTYSFSKLKHNDSFKEQFNDSSIELPKNPKLIDQMEIKIDQLKNQLKKQKQKRFKITQEHKILDEKYQNLLKTSKQKDKQEKIKQQKRQLAKKITTLQQQISILKGEITQKAQQLITYESRSEQSRRLLQKLNQNINKKQSKLIKDKEVIIKELQETKRLLQESRFSQQKTLKQLKQTNDKIEQLVQNRQQQLSNEFEEKMNLFTKEYESRLMEKNRQIKELANKLSQTKAFHEDQMRQMKESIGQDESTRYSTQSLIEQLRQQITVKYQTIQKLLLKNKELLSAVDSLQSKFQQTQNETSNIRQSQTSRINKLQIQIANFQYQSKENEQKMAFFEEENERMNVLVNEIKEDKKILNREKQQLRTQISQKSLQIDNLRNKLEQIKENQIKYSSIIQNYQKQQERFYDQQARQTSIMASLEIKLKANAIDIQKLNLKLSQKQQQLNKTLKDLQKYKKMYKTQHQTLEMYKQQTHYIKEKTQQKWKQLKAYYENEIQLLQEKISHHQSLNANQSRLKIKNLMTNQKARINSSRLSISRGTSKSVDRQDTFNLAIKKKLLYKTNDPDQELKENYWHGLNNDSLDHFNQQGTKN